MTTKKRNIIIAAMSILIIAIIGTAIFTFNSSKLRADSIKVSSLTESAWKHLYDTIEETPVVITHSDNRNDSHLVIGKYYNLHGFDYRDLNIAIKKDKLNGEKVVIVKLFSQNYKGDLFGYTIFDINESRRPIAVYKINFDPNARYQVFADDTEIPFVVLDLNGAKVVK